MFKTEAAASIIAQINPDVQTEAHAYNLTGIDHFAHFCSRLSSGSLTGGKVDMILGCVDNFGARIAINAACCELGLPWFESGVSEDAMGGHIQFIVPGITACFECVPPLIVASGVPESTLKREGVCAASLPTTMGLVSALLVQNALKYLLKFGKVSFFVGYAAMSDYFPAYAMGPNCDCGNNHCRRLQKEWQTDCESRLRSINIDPSKMAATNKAPTLQDVEKWLDFRPLPEDVEVVHEDNEFGITLEGSSDVAPITIIAQTDNEAPTVASSLSRSSASATAKDLPQGLSFSYDIELTPSVEELSIETPSEASTPSTEIRTSLADLRAKLRDSQKK